MRLELERLTKRYAGAGAPAVRELSLAVPDGTVLALAGPSGCGKTTTLRLIAGLESPESGEVRANGHPWNGLPPERRPVAMVFQNGALFPHLTVAENLTLGLRLQRTPRNECAARLQDLARLLRLEALLERFPHALSGGERQRAALGRALMRQPQVLLLDEPLAGLDAPLRRELRGELVALCRRLAPTVLWVTHDQEEALAVGNTLAILRHGALQQVGPPATLYHRPANRFVAQFLGSPPMQCLSAHWERQGAGLALHTAAGRLTPPPEIIAALGGRAAGGAAVEVGFRPEAIRPTLEHTQSDAVLEAVEWAGAQVYWRVRAGAASLLCRAPDPAPAPLAGQPVRLAWDWPQACWFDPQTGDALPVASAGSQP